MDYLRIDWFGFISFTIYLQIRTNYLVWYCTNSRPGLQWSFSYQIIECSLLRAKQNFMTKVPCCFYIKDPSLSPRRGTEAAEMFTFTFFICWTNRTLNHIWVFLFNRILTKTCFNKKTDNRNISTIAFALPAYLPTYQPRFNISMQTETK